MARRNRQTDCQTREDAEGIVPAGSPDWITAELIEATIRTWQPYYREMITPEIAVEMIRSVGQLYRALSDTSASKTDTP